MHARDQAELFLRALSDPLPDQGLEALFIFGQTVDNQGSAFDTAERLYRRMPGLQLLILDGEPRSGYPGFAAWQAALASRGISPDHIQPLPPPETPLLHTRIEALALADHLRRSAYRRVGVTAAPFHQVRAFMTAITVVLEADVKVGLYSCPGSPQRLSEPASHSQGTPNAKRRDLIAKELQRIDTYQHKGDLAGTREALAYLAERDRHDR